MSSIHLDSPTIPKARLGTQGPMVPRIGLGLMGMSVFYGAGGSDEARFEVLDRALAIGETFWDSESTCRACRLDAMLIVNLTSR